jgi:hypothetical protein
MPQSAMFALLGNGETRRLNIKTVKKSDLFGGLNKLINDSLLFDPGFIYPDID